MRFTQDRVFVFFQEETHLHVCGGISAGREATLELHPSDRPIILWLLNRRQSHTSGDHFSKKGKKKKKPLSHPMA